LNRSEGDSEREIAVIVAACEHSWKKNGFDKNGNPRKRCKLCGTSYVDRKFTALGELRVELDDAAWAIELLCEGMSIRAVCRLTGLHIDAVLRIVIRAGRGELSEQMIRGLTVAEVAATSCGPSSTAQITQRRSTTAATRLAIFIATSASTEIPS
jgi:transposase-like protein